MVNGQCCHTSQFLNYLVLVLLLTLPAFCLPAASPPLEIELGPQQTVITVNPKMGVHTRLTDEVEPWKIKRTLEMVREMGAPWIVEYFPWAYHEPFPGFFDWSHSDLVIDHAQRQGLTLIARLGLTPEWARPATRPHLFWLQSDTTILAIMSRLLWSDMGIESRLSSSGMSRIWPWSGVFSPLTQPATPNY